MTSASALPSSVAERLVRFLAEGLHAEMAYLANHVEFRKDPSKLVPGARSVICLAVAYAPVERDAGGTPASRGVIARYARGRDYHVVLKRRAIALMDAIRERAPEFQGRAFVDSAPVAERSLAVLAGLGVIGRNGCLIVPGLGSYVLLAEIVCNLELVADTPLANVGVSRDAGILPACPESVPPSSGGEGDGALSSVHANGMHNAGETPASRGCGGCGRCVTACPTGALRADGLVDARRCASYHTIENRGDFPSHMETAIGNRVFGCDVCQEVCPHNLPQRGGCEEALPAGDAEFAGPASIDLHDVLVWDESQWDVATRGRAIRRATWRMWQRNALAAMLASR
ncbi:MAG: DUF1730 domain-containing protein [Phycisphaerae bacterium]|nr:DUF1730 domain-containing protein [Phycisphaerae bacterium]